MDASNVSTNSITQNLLNSDTIRPNSKKLYNKICTDLLDNEHSRYYTPDVTANALYITGNGFDLLH